MFAPVPSFDTGDGGMGEGGKGGKEGKGGSWVVSKLCGCDVGNAHCVGAEGAAPGRGVVDGRLRASLSAMSCSVSSEGWEMVIIAE